MTFYKPESWNCRWKPHFSALIIGSRASEGAERRAAARNHQKHPGKRVTSPGKSIGVITERLEAEIFENFAEICPNHDLSQIADFGNLLQPCSPL